jgi:hypothetical protein
MATPNLAEVMGSLIALAATATAMGVLHPALVPVLVLSMIAEAWVALRTAQLRYLSMLRMVSLDRRVQIVSELATQHTAAAEIRANQAGPFVLAEYREAGDALRDEDRPRPGNGPARPRPVRSSCVTWTSPIRQCRNIGPARDQPHPHRRSVHRPGRRNGSGKTTLAKRPVAAPRRGARAFPGRARADLGRAHGSAGPVGRLLRLRRCARSPRGAPSFSSPTGSVASASPTGSTCCTTGASPNPVPTKSSGPGRPRQPPSSRIFGRWSTPKLLSAPGNSGRRTPRNP